MKKTIIIVVIAGMFAWAVYDLVYDTEDTAQTGEDDFTVQEDSAEESGGADENTDESDEKADPDEVGLNTGNLAPDFELKTMEGETVRLSDYRGERVMINFWASWCPPCRAEVPDLEKFYKNKDIKLLAINLTSTESNESDIDDFIEEYGMTFPVLLDRNTEVANRYGIQPIPSSFMIDSNGRISFRVFGPMNYERMVQEFEKMS
ncbi:redoxin domain-containing protein [Barrientosiimonas marina]|uniref:Peroxiredoxin family protein n=1 Tax=Lentibacillus kimchii TaxID=1542911 RepID=A0ABW2UTK7_9BACI